jgi:hypothetical protein
MEEFLNSGAQALRELVTRRRILPSVALPPRAVRGFLTLCFLLVGPFAMTSVPSQVWEARATTTFPGHQLLQVPIRWCAIKGSDGADNPGSVGEPTTNDYLWRRHERASDKTLIPGAFITGRSAFAAANLALGFPVISDPNPGAPGVQGDILDPNIDDSELKLAWSACDQAWNALVKPGVPLVGFPAVNIHQFVDNNGNPVFTKGWGVNSYSTSGGGAADLCTNPPTITAAQFQWSGRIAVSDYSITRGFDPLDTFVAHEIGHSLGMDHGNGLDDNNNGLFDLNCDPAENVNAQPNSFMTVGVQSTVVTSLQAGKMRAIALRYSGTEIDPPGALLNADTLSDQKTDVVQDVLDPGIDLASVAVAEIPSTDTTVIDHLLFGLIPLENVENQYLTFLDLDGDKTTGGTPADLGFTTDFKGAELVTRVDVGPGHEPTPSVWIYQGGKFVEVRADLTAEVWTQVATESGQEVANIVRITLPTSVRGAATVPYRLQARAEQLKGDLYFDILPNGGLDVSSPVSPVPPVFPVCGVDPPQANPGDSVTVDVAGLLGDSKAHVVLGDTLVTTGSTDSNGDASIPFTLPGNTDTGPRLVTVGVDGTALTADCFLAVGEFKFPDVD